MPDQIDAGEIHRLYIGFSMRVAIKQRYDVFVYAANAEMDVFKGAGEVVVQVSRCVPQVEFDARINANPF